MAMSETDFKNAFREVASLEFSNIPMNEDSIDFIFSECFNKRMSKLIRTQKKAYYNFVNTTYKRIAIICVVLFTMLTTACSVKTIREPIVSFIKQVYESFTHYSYSGKTTDKIVKESIIKVPDDFNQTKKIKNDALIATEYTNDVGDIIEFKQMTTEYSIGYFVDNENGDIKTQRINGIEVELKERYDTKSAIWSENGYIFAIDCYGNIDWDTIKQMIGSIE